MPQSTNRQIIKEFAPSEMLTLEILERIKAKKSENHIKTLFPDRGPLRRELYVKHMEFFRAGKLHDERLFLAANRVGKSLTGGVEVTFHATGQYPHWWEGRRFDKPTQGWFCNNTAIDVRDINQKILLGDPGQFGTGLIPKDCLIDTKPKSSVPDGVEIIYVRHISGGQSVLTSKAYEQGRLKFQGRELDYIWCDEEVPADVYGEAVIRLMTRKGIMLCTYTPVLGLTPITVKFLRESVNKESLPLKFTSNPDGDKRIMTP